MNIKVTISQEDKERLIYGVKLFNLLGGIDISDDALKTTIENVLCWLHIKDEKKGK